MPVTRVRVNLLAGMLRWSPPRDGNEFSEMDGETANHFRIGYQVIDPQSDKPVNTIDFHKLA